MQSSEERELLAKVSGAEPAREEAVWKKSERWPGAELYSPREEYSHNLPCLWKGKSADIQQEEGVQPKGG